MSAIWPGAEELGCLVVVLDHGYDDRRLADRLVARHRHRPAVEQRVVAAERVLVRRRPVGVA
jgi:hypothetical protein